MKINFMGINHTMFTLIPLIGLCVIKHDKNKKHFCMNSFEYFSSEEILTNHEKARLEISGKQSVNMIEKVATYNLAIITTYCHLPM